MERLEASAFQGDHLRRRGTWAVAFLADWCPFCRAFEPEFEALGGTGAFGIAIGDVTDLDSPLWETFSVEVVPTVVVFRDGEPTFRRDGRLGRGLSEADRKAVRDAPGNP